MKKADKKTVGIGGAAIALAGGVKMPPARPVPSPIVGPEPTKRPRGHHIMLIAKIDPEKRRCGLIPIRTDMRTVHRLVGPKVAEQLLTSVEGGLEIRVCCECFGSGKIWRIRGSIPIRGKAILYGFAGFGPADLPVGPKWLERMIEWEPDVPRAANDKREEPDEPA